MNPALATGPLAQAIGWALLHLLWQGAVIAALLAFLLTMLSGRSANVRYVISCAALALLIVAGVVTGFRSRPVRVAAPVAPSTQVESARPALRVAPLGIAGLATATEAPVRTERIRSFARAAQKALPAIVTLWLVGVALLSARLVLQWLRARRLTRNAWTAPEPWQEAAQRLSAALGVRHAVQLLETAAIEIPSVIGMVRPAILLPASTITGLTPAQLEMILAHELAHIRRHDFLVNLLQAVVETLLFYHPAVWWISKQVRIERENCCDDLAVAACGTPLQYARALTRLEELRAEVLPLAVSANGGSLLERIRRIVGGSGPATGPAVRGAAALAMLVCLLVALAAPSLSAISKQPETRQAWSGFAKTAAERIASFRPARIAYDVLMQPDTRDTDVAEPKAGTPVASEAVDASQTTGVQVNAAAAAYDEGAPVDPESPDAVDGNGPTFSLDEIIELRVQNVTPDRVRELRRLFPRIEVRDMAGMNAVGATPDFVRAMRRAGLSVESPREAQGLAAVGVTPEFVREMRRVGLAVECSRDAQGLAAVGVTPEFVREMRDLGLEVATAHDAQGLAAVGVSAEQIRELRDAGLAIESAREAQGLAAVGVSGEFIREIRRAGLAVESASDAQGLAAVGVTGEFIRSMRDAGLPIESPHDAQGLAAVGVTAEFVRGVRAAGLSIESAAEAQSLAAVGVTPEYVREMRRAGVDFKEASEIQSLRALGITPEFVQRLARAGYRNLSPSDLNRLGAGGMNGDLIQELSKYKSH